MNSSDIEIRKAVLADCDSICDIENACFSDPWSKESFEYQISNPFAEIIGAFEGNVPVGFVNVQYVSGELTVNNIAVTEKYRRKGIAKKLLEYAFEQYPETECVYLEVRESNVPAQRLYEKLGFVKVGKRENYYKSPVEDAWLMTKDMRNG
ncbi:MAG: ribosomal protein S18-alanine N-acetyltransferase [Oscillospiraceae bacterium]